MGCTADMASMGFMLVASDQSTTEVAVPCGNWRSNKLYTFGRGWGEARNRTGNISATPGVQFSNSTTDLTSAMNVALGTAMAAVGITTPPGTPVTLAVSGYKYWRPVWLVKLTTGTTLGTMAVSGVVELTRG